MTYEQYISSDRWRRLRAAAIERDGGRCRLCDADGRLEVHHRRYPPRGQWHLDSLDALTTLCIPCHDIITEKQRATRYGALAAPQVIDLPARPPLAAGRMPDELPRIEVHDHGNRSIDLAQWADRRPVELVLEEHRRDRW
jgi:hypothetical protein